jgi:methionyl-tRNA formyltransferase
MTRPRALFFGTPEFAVPTLAALADIAQVVTVVTQPDRPKGRGMKLAPPPVKQLAERLGIPVLQPIKVRTPEFAASLRDLDAEFALVVAYGRILPPAVLSATRLGCLNVHASLLPKLRGAAPIQWAIVRGERETGVCLMQMDEGMDTGPVLARAALTIGEDETTAELSPRLSELGAQLLQRELPRFYAGELSSVAQDHARATLAPLLRKEDGEVDWSQSARAIHDLVRGFAPWPSAATSLDGVRLKLHRTRILDERAQHAVPGEILSAQRDVIAVACGVGSLALLELQLEGGRRLSAAEFLVGHRIPSAARLGKKS